MSKNFRQKYFLTSYIKIEPLSEKGILDYCRTPRRSADVTKHFGICGRTMMFHYMDELVKEGKLQHTVQNEPRAERRQYITTGSDFNVFSIDALLEYCKTPRRSREIFGHFGMNAKKLFPYLDNLLKEGKLKITTITQNTSQRKYMTVE